MLDSLGKWSGGLVPAAASPFLRRAAPIALAALLFGVIGLAWPLSGSPDPVGVSASPTIRSGTSADNGGVDGFLEMARWGRPISDADKARRDADAAAAAAAAARAAAEARGLNPELARLGVIGISSAADSHAVLLTRPDGTLERLTDGEALPDGRVLVTVSANSLVLEDADGGRGELLLFPRVGAVTVVQSPTDGEDLP